jgi:hypothetical protein
MSNEMSELDMSNGMSELEAKPKSKSKEIIMSKKMSEAEANDISSEMEAIEAEIRELQEDFGDLGLDDDDDDAEDQSTTELDKLNAEIAGTVFEVSPAESSGELTILQIADGLLPDQSMQEGWLPSLPNPLKWIPKAVKRKAEAIISKCLKLVRKYKKLAACAPKVTIAVAAFKTGKYGTALTSGYSAYKCIKARL